jgi:hypothetical protein
MAVFDQKLLLERLRRTWRDGDRLALGWTAVRGALRVLMAERGAFLGLCRAHPELWARPRYRDPATLRGLAAQLGAAARVVEVVVVGAADAALHARMETLVERFAIGLDPQRPVALLDLVGFSKLGPLDQLTRLTALEQSLCRAEAALARAGFGFTPTRTTTGDGFYLWDPDRATAEPARLLALVLTTFVAFAAAGRRGGFDAGALKATLGIGACFTFHRIAAGTPQDDTFIVGAVTVEIARLMEACRPGQILLGTGPRHGQLDPWRRAVARLNDALAEADAAAAHGHRLQAELTGSRDADGTCRLDRYTVRAKHGWTYPAVNVGARATAVDDGRVTNVGLTAAAADRAA